MANDIVLHQVQSVQVGLRQKDGLVNATALMVAYRILTGISKECRHWLATKEASESIAYP
jgi:hypothetical protein